MGSIVGEIVGLDVVGEIVGLDVGPPVGLAVGRTVGVGSKLASSSGFPGLSCRLQAAGGPKSAPRPRNSAKGSARVREQSMHTRFSTQGREGAG